MDMLPVVSSNLSAVGYDAANQQLYVQFHSGSVYVYSNVPQTIYKSLMRAESKGSYHAAYIKHSFPYRRIG